MVAKKECSMGPKGYCRKSVRGDGLCKLHAATGRCRKTLKGKAKQGKKKTMKKTPSPKMPVKLTEREVKSIVESVGELDGPMCPSQKSLTEMVRAMAYLTKKADRDFLRRNNPFYIPPAKTPKTHAEKRDDLFKQVRGRVQMWAKIGCAGPM